MSVFINKLHHSNEGFSTEVASMGPMHVEVGGHGRTFCGPECLGFYVCFSDSHTDQYFWV